MRIATGPASLVSLTCVRCPGNNVSLLLAPMGHSSCYAADMTFENAGFDFL